MHWEFGPRHPGIEPAPPGHQGRDKTFQKVRGDAIHVALQGVVGAELALAAIHVEARTALGVQTRQSAAGGVRDGGNAGGPLAARVIAPAVANVGVVVPIEVTQAWDQGVHSATAGGVKKDGEGVAVQAAGGGGP